MKKWKLRRFERQASAEIAASLGTAPLVADLLCARGMDSPEAAAAFLQDGAGFSDPMLLKDMDLAAQRIALALENSERICVYGDYDCDGITATVLLYRYLETVGADVCYYIPSREEGYGLNRGAIDKMVKFGVKIAVTVDNGISALDEVEYAAQCGIDVVVTDHHTPRERLPEACAVVNPHRKDCPSGRTELSGAGVVFKLICALEGDDGEGVMEQYGDLVAIGTVADVVPLTGENRRITVRGLEVLANTENAGLRALMEAARLDPETLNAESIGYGLAPRINSAARIGSAKDAVDLLMCDDPEEAAALAEELNRYNHERRELERVIMAELEELTARRPELLFRRVPVFCGEGWHHGVIGIVAARMVERTGKPCVLIAANSGVARGSARSVDGFSMIDAVSSCADLLTHYGGHTAAAGLTLEMAQVPGFCDRMQQFARENYPQMPVHTLTIDRILDPRELRTDVIAGLSALEPFGCGNEAPIFALRKMRIEGIYPIGENRHIRIRLRRDGAACTAVYFGMTAEEFPYNTGDTVDIAAGCEINRYNGTESVSVKIKDIRPADMRQEQIFESRQLYDMFRRGEHRDVADFPVPDRADFAAVYRLLREKNGFRGGFDLLCMRIPGMDYCRMRIALDVLCERGLIEIGADGNPEVVRLLEVAGKTDLAQSPVLAALAD